MDTRVVAQNKLCRSYEDFMEELRKKTDHEENVHAGEGHPSTAVQHASAGCCRHDYNKKIIKPACWSEKRYTGEAKSRNDRKHGDGEVKDLLLLGLFCFCLLVLNVACWSFSGGVPVGR